MIILPANERVFIIFTREINVMRISLRLHAVYI